VATHAQHDAFIGPLHFSSFRGAAKRRARNPSSRISH
jgi:hypothetical protein